MDGELISQEMRIRINQELKQLCCGEVASQENQDALRLGVVRLIPQKLKLGIMNFATGK